MAEVVVEHFEFEGVPEAVPGAGEHPVGKAVAELVVRFGRQVPTSDNSAQASISQSNGVPDVFVIIRIPAAALSVGPCFAVVSFRLNHGNVAPD